MSDWVNPYYLPENAKDPETDSFREGWKVWFDDEGSYHREGGPAVIWPDGDCWYYKNGILHRLDGPGVISHKGKYTTYCIEGVSYNELKYWDHPSVIAYGELVYAARISYTGDRYSKVYENLEI